MQKPTFKEALQFWSKLGWISFGGPAGQIAIMHEYLVEKKKWISESRFMHALNYCMILPGPEAQQMATYIGWMMHGIRGGLAAGILFVLPSMFILLGLSMAYVSYGNIPWIYAMFSGLKPAVIAIVILAIFKIGKKSLLSPLHYFIGLAAFVCIFFFNIPFPLIIIGTIILGTIAKTYFPAFFPDSDKKSKENKNAEDEYYINENSVSSGMGFIPKRFAKQILMAAVLWTIPIAVFYFSTSEFPFWKTISVFFTQAALVTFGGAYAVLPYVAQMSVEKYHWLTNLQMIDGLALGETTPGPLIMVLAFVGFMAGHNHYQGSLWMGTLGLVTTTFYTFLPCFLFIFSGAPIIEQTQQNKNLKGILGLVTAAVVGVILNLSIYLGKAVIFPGALYPSGLDYFSLGWIVVSFIALFRFKIGMIKWIGISALSGLINYIITII